MKTAAEIGTEKILTLFGFVPNIAAKPPRKARDPRPGVVLQERIRVCPGGRQAWYMTGLGPVRKPLFS